MKLIIIFIVIVVMSVSLILLMRSGNDNKKNTTASPIPPMNYTWLNEDKQKLLKVLGDKHQYCQDKKISEDIYNCLFYRITHECPPHVLDEKVQSDKSKEILKSCMKKCPTNEGWKKL